MVCERKKRDTKTRRFFLDWYCLSRVALFCFCWLCFSQPSLRWSPPIALILHLFLLVFPSCQAPFNLVDILLFPRYDLCIFSRTDLLFCSFSRNLLVRERGELNCQIWLKALCERIRSKRYPALLIRISYVSLFRRRYKADATSICVCVCAVWFLVGDLLKSTRREAQFKNQTSSWIGKTCCREPKFKSWRWTASGSGQLESICQIQI